MATIALRGMEFFAYHGFYEEERKIGNRYHVDIVVKTELPDPVTDEIRETVNYEQLYAIAKKEMEKASKLLEHVAYRIASQSLEEIQTIEKVRVTVRKHNPPVGGVCRAADVSLKLKR